jgi:DNA invertase Pin-like site-specific DNA recombinase
MRVVSYLRVSTAKQGMSGLGLEAQRAAVEGFAAAHHHDVICEFLEVESGKRDDRPQLEAALATCRLHRATLVIAKLDRLARNVAFIANLMDGGVEFLACDMPHANRLTLHLLAAIAEHEREMISQRTKAALAAAKARGVKLGNPNGAAALRDQCREAAARSAAVRKARAARHLSAIAPLIHQLRSEGYVTPRPLAAALNQCGVPSPSGGAWYPERVRRLLLQLSLTAL